MTHPTSASSSLPPVQYWRKTRRLTLLLLAVWFSATFVAVFYARELDRVMLFGWPLSFYMAAQGIPLLYLAIVAIYTMRAGRLERQLSCEQAHEE